MTNGQLKTDGRWTTNNEEREKGRKGKEWQWRLHHGCAHTAMHERVVLNSIKDLLLFNWLFQGPCWLIISGQFLIFNRTRPLCVINQRNVYSIDANKRCEINMLDWFVLLKQILVFDMVWYESISSTQFKLERKGTLGEKSLHQIILLFFVLCYSPKRQYTCVNV